MKLSESAKYKLKESIVTHLVNDGEDHSEAAAEADFILEDLEEDIFSFILFDALGTDDAGLREQNPELENLYQYIFKLIQEQSQSTVH